MEENMNQNNMIIPLKGADRIRKRPAVLFGSEGIDGCGGNIKKFPITLQT